MRKHKFLIIGALVALIGVVMIVGSGIADAIFEWNNPDMTDMRRLIENPSPTITSVIGCIVLVIGSGIAKRD